LGIYHLLTYINTSVSIYLGGDKLEEVDDECHLSTHDCTAHHPHA